VAPAHAAEAPAGATAAVAPPAAEPQVPGEIVVTAQRRAEAAQTVPISIKAFSTAQLQNAQVHNMGDLTAITPGLLVTSNGGSVSSAISLRGLSKVPIGSFLPAVVIYFNDVALPTVGVNVPAFDLTNVQVLKGPQGTLFGRNTIGGAVLLTPVAPTYDFNGFVSGSLGNYNYVDIQGAVNVPIVADKLAIRIAGEYRKRHGYEKDLNGGPDLDDLNEQSIRASLLFEPTDAISNTLIVSDFHSPQTSNATIATLYRPGVLPEEYGAQVQAVIDRQNEIGPRKTYVDPGPGNFSRRDNLTVTNTTKLDLSDNVTIKNIFGYVRAKVLLSQSNDDMPDHFDGSLGPFTLLKSNLISRHQYLTDEFQVLGKSFDQKLDWVVGGFWAYDTPYGPEGTLNQAFDFSGGQSIAHTSQLQTNTQYSIYAHASLDLSDWLLRGLKLTGGYRQSWDRVDACGKTQVVPYGPGHLTDGFLTDAQCRADPGNIVKGKDTEPTYSVGLDWQVSRNALLYVVHRASYRGVAVNLPAFYSPYTTGGAGCILPGTIGTPIQCPDLRPYQTTKPEKIKDVEIGAKTTWRAGSVRGLFNVALYESWLKGSVQNVVLIPAGIPQTAPDYPAAGIFAVNVADIRIRGIETDLTIAPSSSLSFTFSGSHVLQSITSLNVPSLAPGSGGLPFDKSSVNLPSPKWSGTASVDWTLPFHPLHGDLVLNADVYATTKYEAQNSYTLPGYSVTNARLDLKHVGGTNLDIGIWTRNLFNKLYDNGAAILIPSFPFEAHFYAEPRTVGVEARYTW
jgi:iron complex outermembrane receptor protein